LDAAVAEKCLARLRFREEQRMPIDDLAIRYPQRATTWQLRTRTLPLPRRPLLMGIVNVTPDSFSDGGKFFDPQQAIDHALRLVDQGADLLDIGGESTRPYATPVDAEEELRRVLSVVEAICRRTTLPVSIDTSKPAVAAAAVAAGAEIINDITGLTNAAMIDLARQTSSGVCVMHMQGTPQTMQDQPLYGDVVEDIHRYLAVRLSSLITAGIDPARICLDPGVGFGKTHQHNLTLASRSDRFHDLGRPVLVGHSRKGFIGKVLGDKTADRTAGTVGVALALARLGVQILRVHEVRPVREALLLFEAVGGIDGREATIT
jgi:dihydropteroate synthase